MDKLKMCSLDGVAKNIELIGQLFPNAITEVKRGEKLEKAIDFDILRQELSDFIVEGREERYQFTWPDKKKAILAANAPINATLRPIVADSVAKDGTPGGFDSENLYIEGDNLEVLKLLRETYLGKVKMIYIDPPYNTGNDFVYEDDFSAKAADYLENSGQFDEYGQRMVTNLNTNGRFHTDWLNMIYPRLKVARDLLADDGVIFISIDDNEQENLKKICDEIFGESNFATTFLWTKTSTPPSLSYKCRKTVEYVFAYEKKLSKSKYFGGYLDGGDAPLLNAGNQKKNIIFPPHSIQFTFMKNGNIRSGQADKVSVVTDITVEDYWNKNEVTISGEFKWGQATVNEEIKNGTYFIAKSEKLSIRFQRANLDNAYKTPNNYLNIELNKKLDIGTNESAIKEIEALELNKYFDYPKPCSLLKALINMICFSDSNSLILDFFSGSATTAHAVMQLNAEDGGQRKYIMVQLPELTSENSEAYKAGYKNICEIGKERIRRAGRKIKEEAGLMAQDLDFGFRCLRLDSSNMKDVYYKPEDLGQMELDELIDNVKDDRSAEDLLFQVMLELSLNLSLPIETVDIVDHKVFKVDDGYLIACFEPNITEEVVTAIAKETPVYAVLRDSSLLNDSLATNFEQIFKAYSPATKTKVL